MDVFKTKLKSHGDVVVPSVIPDHIYMCVCAAAAPTQ